MKLYRKLQRDGAKEHLPRHFENVVGLISELVRSPKLSERAVSDGDVYAEEYLAYNLNRKAVSPFGCETDDEALKQKTLLSFLARESVNRKINETDAFGYNPVTGLHEDDGSLGLSYLLRAREIILDVLGTTPDLDRVVKYANFGSGASATLKRVDATREHKFKRGISVTSGLAEFARSTVESSPVWMDAIDMPKADVFSVDSHGKVSTLDWAGLIKLAGAVMGFVPKDASIHRIILMEPELNGFLQKGAGRLVRELLGNYNGITRGIDLNSSGALNSAIAKYGSISGTVATVDAERASDSITVALCEFLLQPQWFDLFMMLRSPYCVLPGGKTHRLQMMAGMGNGFCFELESVIFWAIGLACAEHSAIEGLEVVSIHGDDLTVPADVFWRVQCAFKRAGIQVNKSKSFCKGPFRESCGGHFYHGQSVKPFYRKASNGYNRGDWFWLANSLQAWLGDRSVQYLSDPIGCEIVQILFYLRWYSSNGKPWLWSCPESSGRRRGLWSDESDRTRQRRKFRAVMDTELVADHDDLLVYVAWLHTPVLQPSVLQLLTREKSSTDNYSHSVETYERERYTRYFNWVPLAQGLSTASLWAAIDLHESSLL